MRKCVLVLFLFALAGATDAGAQPTIYVSNLTGQQVLTVDGTNGTTKILFSAATINSATFTPEDMVIGPDGKLYICDVGTAPGIWRFDPNLAIVPSPGTQTNPPNPRKIVSLATTIVPVGPTFSGSDDFYFNTRGSGVYAVPGVATPNTGPTYTASQVFTSSQAGNGGGGTTVEAFGHLLIVDQPNGKVLSANVTIGAFPNFIPPPPPNPLPTLISGLSSPVGIATNTCQDVLVASGSGIQRFGVTKDPSTLNLIASSLGTYVDFGKSNPVAYFERDAANNLFVATNGSQSGGIIWKVTPVGDPISSCGGTPTVQQLVSFKKLSTGSNPLLLSSQTQAVGVAIPASNYTATASFDSTHPSATFNFGHYSLTLAYTQVVNAFKQTFTALMSKPTDFSFNTAVFPTNAVGMRFPSLGGFVIQFQTKSQVAGCTAYQSGSACDVPVSGTDYLTDANGIGFKITLAFHDPIRGFNHPGLAHANDDSTVYTQDVTSDFWVLNDQATRGTGSTWGSKYVPFDEQFTTGLALPLHVQVNQPALSNNPLFNLGQNFTVSILVSDNNGVAVPGLVLRISAARIVPGPPFSLEIVQATNNTTQGNLLNDNGNGKYSIGIDTSLFTGGPGTYQFTIFGQGFPPVLNPPLSNIALPFNAVFQK